MTNLFKAAKEAKPAKPAKATKAAVELPQIASDLERLAEVSQLIDALTAEAKLLTETVKSESVAAFIELYEDTNKYPGSFDVNAGMASMLFIPMDKYTMINEERAMELSSKYGKGMIEETTVYQVNSELVEKYGEELSSLILKSKKIAEEDKARLITAQTKWAIQKGAITSINTLTESYDYTIEEVIQDIKPVFSMKNVKLV